MLAEWRRNMADLAEAPNVYLKVGGIGYKSFVEQSVLDGPRSSEFLAEYWKPEICFAIEPSARSAACSRRTIRRTGT